MVLIFSVLNKAQIYKTPNRDSPHLEIEIRMSPIYMSLGKPNEHTEDYHIRKPKDKIFLLEIEEKKYNYVGENLVSFETNDKIVKYSLHHGFDNNKLAFGYGEENISNMFQRKYIPIQKY